MLINRWVKRIFIITSIALSCSVSVLPIILGDEIGLWLYESNELGEKEVELKTDKICTEDSSDENDDLFNSERQKLLRNGLLAFIENYGAIESPPPEVC